MITGCELRVTGSWRLVLGAWRFVKREMASVKTDIYCLYCQIVLIVRCYGVTDLLRFN